MNLRLLKAESYSITTAYIMYIFIQAPYAYIGKWGYQLLYWLVVYPLYASIFILLGMGDTELDFLKVLGLVVMALVCGIWPVVMFFALPNLVKKENLKLYETIKNRKE